jgi:hypothetical protein
MDFSVAAICWSCSPIIGIIALWILKRRKPIHFLAGTAVEPQDITDIPAYNRANAKMWAGYAAWLILIGALSLLNSTVGIALSVASIIPGVFFLYIPYKRIYNKYKTHGA